MRLTGLILFAALSLSSTGVRAERSSPRMQAAQFVNETAGEIICGEAHKASLLGPRDVCWAGSSRLLGGIYAGPVANPMRYDLSDWVDVRGRLKDGTPPAGFARGATERKEVDASVVAKLLSWFRVNGSA